MNLTLSMKKHPARMLMTVLVSLSIVAMASGCGEGGTEPAAPTEAPAEAPAAEPTEEPTSEPTAEPEATEELAAESEATEEPMAETEAAQPPETGGDMGGDVESLLANATYPSDFTQDGTAPLVDGTYAEQAAPGSAISTTVTLLPQYTTVGDLNGQPAAATIIATNPGGSGTFISLAVVTYGDGQPVTVATTQLGDRVQVNSVAIEDNEIVVDMLTQGPDDPMCCPSQQVAQVYELQDGQLELVNTEELGSSTAAANPDPVAPETDAPAVEFPEAAEGVPTGVIVADEGVNVRTGPGTDYPIIGIAPPGTVGEIVGISADGQWWMAAVAAGPEGHGWVSTAYVEAVNADDVPVIPTPPLP